MSFYINDFALNNALGCNKHQIHDAIINELKYHQTKEYLFPDGKKTPIFEVPSLLLPIPNHLSKYDTRNNQLLLLALSQVEETIHSHISLYGKQRIGIVFATSTSGIDEGIKAFEDSEASSLPENYNYYKQEMSSPSDFVREYFDLSSISYTISTACSSGARAIIEATRLIENNFCDSVIVGASDSLNPLTLNGFYSLGAIDHEHTKPFMKDRSGINIGEGAAIFILSRQESQCKILGYGESSDAYHSSSPHPQGLGAILAMKQAMTNANLIPDMIDYINLHGTGTCKNDEMEAIAIDGVFGKCSYRSSSTKTFTGHCLGTAGLQELAICALIIGEFNTGGLLPLDYAHNQYDESLIPIQLSKPNEAIFPRICMSNSYAFGGNNVSLIIGAI